MNYFIYQDEQEKGPYPIGEIIKSVNYGYIAPSTLAREESATEWIEVSSIVDISIAQAIRIKENQQAQAQAEFYERAGGQEQRAQEKREIIGTSETPLLVHFLNAVGLIMAIIGFVSIAIGLVKGGWPMIFDGLKILVSALSLYTLVYFIDSLSECVFRLRNIEVNTAKAAEKNDR